MSHFWFNLNPLINWEIKYFFLIFSMTCIFNFSVYMCMYMCLRGLPVRVLCIAIWGTRFSFLFFNPHPRIHLLILERERDTSMWERNINWLPPVHAPTMDQTHNRGMCPDWNLTNDLSVSKMSLQPIWLYQPRAQFDFLFPDTSFGICRVTKT